MKHRLFECKQPCDKPHCMWCEGGLAGCMVCMGLEGSLPTDCPGVLMTQEQQDDVYKRAFDFIHGEWVGPNARSSPMYRGPTE